MQMALSIKSGLGVLRIAAGKKGKSDVCSNFR